MAKFHAFKFPSSNTIQFTCAIRVCFGKCQPVNCGGVNAFGRRRRKRQTPNDSQVFFDDSDRSLASTGTKDDVREEVKVSSNPILTYEPRPGADPNALNAGPKSDAQKVDDDEVCISTLSIIISLLLTALLALVAVAIAVACFLLARRRTSTRPIEGPLPHPPEFPNPLLTRTTLGQPSQPSSTSH
jgi:hypothetical protein